MRRLSRVQKPSVMSTCVCGKKVWEESVGCVNSGGAQVGPLVGPRGLHMKSHSRVQEHEDLREGRRCGAGVWEV